MWRTGKEMTCVKQVRSSGIRMWGLDVEGAGLQSSSVGGHYIGSADSTASAESHRSTRTSSYSA